MFDDPGQRWRFGRDFLALAVALAATAVVLDTPVALMASGLSPRVERVGAFVTTFGLSNYMFALSALVAAVALWRRSRTDDRMMRFRLALVAERAVFFFAAVGVSGILVQIVKHVVGRTRPTELLKVGAFHFAPFSLQNTYASFPSGHTTSAFSAAAALSLIAPWARPVWFLAATLIGLSRVVVHAHYPSDVLAGAALGSVTTFGVVRWLAARSIAFVSTPAGPMLKVAPQRTAR